MYFIRNFFSHGVTMTSTSNIHTYVHINVEGKLVV